MVLMSIRNALMIGLLCAINYKNIQIAKYLLENGADICAKQPDGCNVLHVAAKHGDERLVELVKILIEHD